MIFTLGEALVDMIEVPPDLLFVPALGGSVANFTVAVARQGASVTYLNNLSADFFGQRFTQWMQSAGVNIAASKPSAKPTSIAFVSKDADNKPTYSFIRDGVADRSATTKQLINRLAVKPQLVHTGCLALVPADLNKTLQVLEAAKTRGALVSVDANLRPSVATSPAYVAGVLSALATADIIKVSDDDCLLMGIEPNVQVVRKRLMGKHGAHCVALTLGAKGAWLITQQHAVFCAPPKGLRVKDSVGAGDCFFAGLVAHLNQSQLLSRKALASMSESVMKASLGHAIAAASLSVQRVGCDPANWQETSALAKKMSVTITHH
jgi:fructokinase